MAGLLSGIMPGEWGQGGGGILDGSNPMFNMGLGILANNTGHYGALGPALGGGMQQGMQQTQLARQQAVQNQMYKLQQDKLQKDLENEEKRRKALENFDQKFPQYAGLADIDEKAALKIAYPDLATNSADPYYQFLPTPSGYAAGNARTGQINLVTGPDGKPYIKSSDSPQLQGTIAANKSYGENLYKPTDMQDGVIKPMSNLAIEAGAPPLGYAPPPQMSMQPQGLPPAMPQQPPQAAMPPGNSWQIPQAVQKQRDDTRLKILLAEQQSEGGPGKNPELDKEIANMSRGSAGIKIPTKAEQEQAKSDIQAKKELDIARAKPGIESAAKREATMSGIGGVIAEARSVLTGKVKPTSSRTGTLVDAVGTISGHAPEGAAEADRLKAIGGALVAKMPRMEGPQSDFDVQNYREMAGQVGDSTIPISRRLAALDEVEKLWSKYDKTATTKTQSPAKQAIPLPAKPSKMTLKKGVVYQTPKGPLTWNGQAFED